MSSSDDPASRLPDPAGQWAGWMRAAQDGDRDAYDRLLRAIVPFLRRRAGRVFRDAADIDDAVQDILIAVHTARASYDPARPIIPWLVGIAQHRIADLARRRGRVRLRETPLEDAHETFAAARSKQDDVAIDAHALRAALARLPAGQRVAIEELKLQEMPLKTVAERTGMSIAALKVATHRGLKRLRDLLRERGDA
ncbi:MAG: sigma-70 family RNA polymerase sigma factor [Acetobacteraceae bacterium]